VIVNTCGFIDAAVDESLEAIGEALAENGKVIVTGCLGAQPQKILDRHPQVLKITGPQRYEEVVASVHEHLPPQHEPFLDLIPAQGVKLTPRHYAYLKISEGCNHRCSFCIIPSMRGDLVSRPVGEVLREAEQLVRAGVKEILVISQDTSAYGVDLKYASQSWRGADRRARFYDLAAALGELGAWVRLHYVYPYPHVDQVIELMAEDKVLPYLDIPFQHASARILKLMKRPAAAENTLERIAGRGARHHHSQHFHRRFSRRNGRGFRGTARVDAHRAARSGGMLRVFPRGGRRRQRTATDAGAGGDQARTARPIHGA
jgi:ribosomal protein S12 methylthiotransferase